MEETVKEPEAVVSAPVEGEAENKAAQQEQSKEAPSPSLIECPCCGKRTLQRPLKPKQEVTDMWLACMISGEPFSRVYEIYGGRIRVTATQLSPDVSESIERIASVLDSAVTREWIDTGLRGKVEEMRSSIRLYSYVTRIEVSAGGPSRVFLPQAAMLEASRKSQEIRDALTAQDSERCVALLEALYKSTVSQDITSSLPIPMVITVVDTHNRLAALLTNSGFDENFWKGIELA